MSEVASFVNESQFEGGESAYICVAFCAALCRYAGRPGQSPTGTGEQVDQLADYWYAKLEGSSAASNTNGMSLQAEYTMLQGLGLKYYPSPTSLTYIKAWLHLGYPLLICGAETGMYDLDLGRVPYAWTPTGNHCIVACGVASDGNLLVRDTASIAPTGVRPGPRRYDASKLQLISATAISMPWLPVQAAGFDPTKTVQVAQAPQYADISSFQPLDIDWVAYKKWSASVDGVSRVAMRSTQGTGSSYVDQHYKHYLAGALAAGIDIIIHYHYSYPQFNSAIDEADWQHTIVGNIRPNDLIMLDYEEGVPQATAAWAYDWLARQEHNYGGKLPIIYASDNYVRTRLQDGRLARFPLVLANWQYTPSERPSCPPPWQIYTFLQYSDKATNIPGIAGSVDANIYLGKEKPMSGIPSGWTDDGITLHSPSPTQGGLSVPITGAIRAYILGNAWDYRNVALAPAFHANQFELSNATLGSGEQQLFRWAMLCVPESGPSAGKVIWEWTGVELAYTRDALKAAAAEITALQAQLAAAEQQQGIPENVVTQRLQAAEVQAQDISDQATALVAAMKAPLV